MASYDHCNVSYDGSAVRDFVDVIIFNRFGELDTRCRYGWRPRRPSPVVVGVELEPSETLPAASGLDLEHVEADRLGEGTALANGDGVALPYAEAGGDVGGGVRVALLVTGVLGDEVHVVTAKRKLSVEGLESRLRHI